MISIRISLPALLYRAFVPAVSCGIAVHHPRRYRDHMGGEGIRTERLLLRRWQDSDVSPYAAICADPEVMRYVASGEVRTPEQSRAAILAFEEEWREKGFGLFAVERSSDAQLIGFTGLSMPTFLPEIMPAVEIGWRFARSSWGMGYATEAARAVLDFGLRHLRLPEIVSIYQVGNDASRRIVEKLGMTYERETIDPSSGRIVQVYRTGVSE
jgi:RimJ/RimL family protein N-acetyltransferase